MKKFFVLLGALGAIAMLLVPRMAPGVASAGQATTGNGAPSGPHYDLNIHGTKGPVDMSTNSNGHDIFVPLNSNGDAANTPGCDDIKLTMGAFAVLNPDCWTGVAPYPEFQLPNPCPTYSSTSTSCTTAYTVWVKALTPKGNATMQTCYYDGSAYYCATGLQVVYLTKKTGSGGFENVTQELLFYCNNTTGLQPIFSPSTYQYFWDYDNAGLKLAQLRFYPNTSATVSTGGGSGSCTNQTGF